MSKTFSLAQIFLLISQKKQHHVLADHANNITAEQWLAVRKNKDAERFYWELVGSGFLSEDIVYWVETRMMAEE